MKNILTYVAVITLGLVSSAFAADPVKHHSEVDVVKDTSGAYDRTVKTTDTDALGTTTKTKVTQDMDVGDDGATEAKMHSNTVRDPEGLGNKTSSKSAVTVTTDKNGNTERVVESVDSAGTARSGKSSVESTLAADGTRTTKELSKSIEDPKGLLNKNTVETKRVEEKLLDGTTKVTQEKLINGAVVKSES